MEFQNTSLYIDTKAVLDSEQVEPMYVWTGYILIGGVQHPIIKILNVDFVEEYHARYNTTITVQCVVGMGFYAKQIFPNREKLEFLLYKKDYFSRGTAAEDLIPYRALLADEGNPLIEDERSGLLDEASLDVSDLAVVTFQLVDKTIDQLRLVTTGTAFRNTTVEDALYTALSDAFQQVQAETDFVPVAVDMVKPNNTRVYEQIPVPHNTPIVDLPGLMQERLVGVYNAGLGHFIKNRYWYVYPLFDVNRADRTGRFLNVCIVPTSAFPAIENSWMVSGSMSMIVCTGERKLQENAQKSTLNQGNGVRFTDASNFMGQVEADGTGRALLSRAKAVNEFVAETSSKGLNLAPSAPSGMTANRCREYSKLASRQGSYLTAVWEFSNPDLLYPGMRARVRYMEEDVMREAEAVLQAAVSSVQLAGKGGVPDRHVTVTGLTFYITRDLDLDV